MLNLLQRIEIADTILSAAHAVKLLCMKRVYRTFEC